MGWDWSARRLDIEQQELGCKEDNGEFWECVGRHWAPDRKAFWMLWHATKRTSQGRRSTPRVVLRLVLVRPCAKGGFRHMRVWVDHGCSLISCPADWLDQITSPSNGMKRWIRAVKTRSQDRRSQAEAAARRRGFRRLVAGRLR